MARPTYTPGPGGYALAVLASLVVFVALVATGTAITEQDPAALIWLGCLGLMYGAIPAVVLGTPGALAVHYACRHQPRQWVHVVAAGVAGVVAGLVPWAFVVPEQAYSLWVAGLGISTAVGRAVVIPLVRPPAERARTATVGG